MDISVFITAFLENLSGYKITNMAIHHYVRINYYANFKVYSTKRVVFLLLLVQVFLVFLGFQAIMALIAFISRKQYIFVLIYYMIRCLVISGIILLHILTMQTSNALCHESRISASRSTNKKIAKISVQIMSLFGLFVE